MYNNLMNFMSAIGLIFLSTFALAWWLDKYDDWNEND